MRLLDRYATWQLIPVWLWCVVVFVFLTCLIDLFGRLDEILRYHIPAETVLQYYVNFAPYVLVRASPLALLLSTAFVTMRLARHQELLAMNASGVSPLRASVPCLFVGWLASLGMFFVNDLVVPKTSPVSERLLRDIFRERAEHSHFMESVALMDESNRLYHARSLDLKARELRDLTVLEHDAHNLPTTSLYASRAIWTTHGWLLLYGTLYRLGPHGTLLGEPQPFVERLIRYPVTPESFAEPQAQPETMRYGQLRLFISRLQHTGILNVQRYAVELTSKVTLPLMNVVIGFIGFVGSAQSALRAGVRGFGVSLGWGMLYYLIVATCHGIAKRWAVPIPLALWAPHLIAAWWCVRRLTRTP